METTAKEWAEIIEYAEAKLKRIILRGAQLQAIIGVFRGHAQAGDPPPTALIESARAQREAVSPRKRRK